VSNTWVTSNDPGSTLAPLPQARGGMGKAVYYNGDFYVMGGETVNGGTGATANNVYNRVDIYNLAANTWRLGTPMPYAKHGIFPVLRGNRIYVVAGGPISGPYYSSEFDIYITP
jgi:N-acetylneuraminic acid mutarotase